MKKRNSVKKNKISRDTKDFMTLVFIFSLSVGILLTVYLTNQALGQNNAVTQAAGPQNQPQQ